MSDEVLLAYLAGFFDGEGTLHIVRAGGTISPRCQVAQNSIEVLEMFKARFGGRIGLYSNGTNRKIYHWAINGKAGILPVVESLLPYLVVKREEAEIMRRFLSEGVGAVGDKPSPERLAVREECLLQLQQLRLRRKMAPDV
jgi:hypothetical protein